MSMSNPNCKFFIIALFFVVGKRKDGERRGWQFDTLKERVQLNCSR